MYKYKQLTDKVLADINLANIFKIFQSTIFWWCTLCLELNIKNSGETSAYTLKTTNKCL